MANITGKTELNEAPADGDKLYIVDVSDTTDNANGSDKHITAVNLKSGLQAEPSEGAFVDGDKTKLDGIATSAIANVVEDTTPQLGGDLDTNGNSINITNGQQLDFGADIALSSTTALHGDQALHFGGEDNFKDLTFPKGMALEANTNNDGTGNYAPYLELGASGLTKLINTTQGTSGNKRFDIDVTDGLKLKTGGASFWAHLKADNITTSDKEIQLPDTAGTIALRSDIASGTITPRADDINFSGGTDGDVLTVQADGSLAVEALSGGGDALTSNPLSQFASTTSAQLAGVMSDETGTGAVVFAESPTLVTPALGTPASGVATNLTGTASGLTAGNATQASALKSATTTVNVDSATAPTTGQVLTATGTTAATWQTPAAGSGTTWSLTHRIDYLAAAIGGNSNIQSNGATNVINTNNWRIQTGTSNNDSVAGWKNNWAPAVFSSYNIYDRKARWEFLFSYQVNALSTTELYLGIHHAEVTSASQWPLSVTEEHIGVFCTVSSGTATWYASNANGTTRTSTDITSFMNQTSSNAQIDTVAIELDGGTDIKYYINGTLRATHTTNLPSGIAGNSGHPLYVMTGNTGLLVNNRLDLYYANFLTTMN